MTLFKAVQNNTSKETLYFGLPEYVITSTYFKVNVYHCKFDSFY